MKKFYLLLTKLICLGLIFVSCEKKEGEGGSGNIVGKVYKIIDDGAIEFDSTSGYYFVKDTVLACDEDVFIVYGDNEYGYDDKVSTNHNGTYKFNYLNDGKYTIYTFSDYGSGEKVAEVKNVEVVDEGSTMVEDIYIQDGKNVGYCGIVGKIIAKYEDAIEPLPGVGVRVYLKSSNGTTIEDTRANEEGLFAFAKLESNTEYTIFAENEIRKDEGIKAVSITIKTGNAGEIVSAQEEILVKIY